MVMQNNELSPQDQALLIKLLEACHPPIESVDRASLIAWRTVDT